VPQRHQTVFGSAIEFNHIPFLASPSYTMKVVRVQSDSPPGLKITELDVHGFRLIYDSYYRTSRKITQA
jgi:hypothetical protein